MEEENRQSEEENRQSEEENRHPEAGETDQETEVASELGIIELIYGILFKPVSTFRVVRQTPPIFKSLLLFSIVVIGNLLVSITLAPHSLAGTNIPAALQQAVQATVPFLAVIGAVFSYLNWVILGGILHLFAELFEGRGSALGTLSMLGLIEIPRLITIPFQVLGAVVNQPFAATFLTVLGSMLYLLWWSVLLVIGIREIHAIPTGKALAVLAVPVFFAGLAMIVILIAGIGGLLPLLNILSRS